MHKYRLLTIPGVLALAFVILIAQSISPVARAQTGLDGQGIGGGPARPSSSNGLTAVTPVPGGPGFFSVSSFTFMPLNTTQPPAYTAQGIYNPGTTNAFYIAPVTLPNHVSVTQITIYFQDSDPQDMTATLYMCSDTVLYCSAMTSVGSSGAAAGIRNATSVPPVTTPVIDLQSNSYVVQIAMPPTANVVLYDVRIDYAFDSALPAIMKTGP